MERSAKQLAKELGVLVSILVVAFIILDKSTNIFNDKKTPKKEDTSIVINAPDDPENIYDGTGGPEEPKILDISTEDFSSQNLYDPKIYSSSSVDVAFKGDFETAELHIEGNIDNDLKNFLFIGFGTLNGTYGAERIKPTQIKYASEATFTKKEQVDLTIDMMSPIKISTSFKEFNQGFGSSKSPRIWDFVQPPVTKKDASKVKIAIAFYDENGKFGQGSAVTKLQILYRCKDSDPDCRAAVCPKNKYSTGSACLEDLFGKGSGEKYGQYFLKKKP